MSNYQTTLPSVIAAEKFLKGEPGGVSGVVLSTVERAGLILIGLFLAGERKRLIRYSLAGALVIEAVVLARVKKQLKG